jgi:bifunctional DNase/RNase
MPAQWFELIVRGVEMPDEPALPAIVVVGPVHPSGGPECGVQMDAWDAHLLQHELAGEATIRSQAILLVSGVAAALRGRLTGARLIQVAPELFTAAVLVDTPWGPAQVATEPSLALAIAVALGVPLQADAALFLMDDPAEQALSPAVTAFLDSLIGPE